MDNITESICIKAPELRKIGYDNLEEWVQADPTNHLITCRQGRVFITEPGGDKHIFNYPRSKWANPFSLKDYTLEESLSLYLEHLKETGLDQELAELKGKKLGCFCVKKTSDDGTILCHAEILAGMVNGDIYFESEESEE